MKRSMAMAIQRQIRLRAVSKPRSKETPIRSTTRLDMALLYFMICLVLVQEFAKLRM